MRKHHVLAVLTFGALCSAQLPPFTFVSVLALGAAGNCHVYGATDHSWLSLGSLGNDSTTMSREVHCTVPIGPATIEAGDIDWVSMSVADRHSTYAVTATFCYRDLETLVTTCGSPASTTGVGNQATLIVAPPSAPSGPIFAFVKVTLPAAGGNMSEVHGYRVFTH